MATAKAYTTGQQMAARARSMTPEAWEHRAKELAKEKHLDWYTRFIGRHAETGEYLFEVPSTSDKYRVYIIAVDKARLTVRHLAEDCTAHQFGLPCGHCGAAIDQFRRMMPSALRELPPLPIVPEWMLGRRAPMVAPVAKREPETLEERNAAVWRQACGW